MTFQNFDCSLLQLFDLVLQSDAFLSQLVPAVPLNVQSLALLLQLLNLLMLPKRLRPQVPKRNKRLNNLELLFESLIQAL